MVGAQAARSFMKDTIGTTGRPGNGGHGGRGTRQAGDTEDLTRVHRQMEECSSRHRCGKGWPGTRGVMMVCSPGQAVESKGQSQGSKKGDSGGSTQVTNGLLPLRLCWEGKSTGRSAGQTHPLQHGPCSPYPPTPYHTGLCPDKTIQGHSLVFMSPPSTSS